MMDHICLIAWPLPTRAIWSSCGGDIKHTSEASLVKSRETPRGGSQGERRATNYPYFEELGTAIDRIVYRNIPRFKERQTRDTDVNEKTPAPPRAITQAMPMERLYEETRITSIQNTSSLARVVGKTSSGKTQSNRCTCFSNMARR